MLISEVLNSDIYESVWFYLESNGYEKVSELTGFDYNELFFIPSVSEECATQAESLLKAAVESKHEHEIPEPLEMSRQEYRNLPEEADRDYLMIENSDSISQCILNQPPLDLSQIKVLDAFAGVHGYNELLKYCEENEISYVSGLCDFDFAPFNFEFLSQSYLKELYKRYRDLFLLQPIVESAHKTNVNSTGKKARTELNEENWSIPIKVLKQISRKFVVFNNLSEKIITVYDLQRLPENTIRTQLGELVDILKQSACRLFAYCLEIINDPAFTKRIQGYTLEEAGKEENITRERVRQRALKASGKLMPIAEQIANIATGTGVFASVQDIAELFKGIKNENAVSACIFTLKDKNSIYEYIPFKDAFLMTDNFNGEQLSDALEAVIKQFSSEDGQQIIIDSQWDVISEVLEQNGIVGLEIQDMEDYLVHKNWKEYNGGFFRDRFSYSSLMLQIITNEFNNGIRIYEKSDLQKLRKIFLAVKPDVELPSDRAISARLVDNLVLAGRGTYKHPANIYFEPDSLNDVVSYIQNSPNEIFSYNDLYTLFSGVLSLHSDIDSPQFLHGMLKSYYPDDYTYSRDVLTKLGTERKNMSQRVEEYLANYDHPVSLNEMYSEFPSMNMTVMNNVIEFNRNVIQWGCASYIHIKNLRMSEKEAFFVKGTIQEICSKKGGCISNQILYNGLKKQHAIKLKTYCVSDAMKCYSFCLANFRKNFNFSNPNIALLSYSKKPCTTKYIMLQSVDQDGVLYLEEIKHLSDKMQWSVHTRDAAIYDIISEYIRLDENRYISKERFLLEQSSLDEIVKVLKSKIVEKEYISVQDYIDFSGLPDIKYMWTQLLLISIIRFYCSEFRILTPHNSSRWAIRQYVVEAKSQIHSYEQLVVYMMKKRRITSIPEKVMLGFLSSYGLAMNIIPQELYNGEYIKFVNNHFIVI